MCKANVGARRTLGLDSKLKTRLDERCQLVTYDHSKGVLPQRENFKPSLCYSLGVCVCGQMHDAVWCHSNIRVLFQHMFWKKRKKKNSTQSKELPEMSIPRKLLEDGLIFFRDSITSLECATANEQTSISTRSR